MMDLWQTLQSETKPIVLYGMGNGAQAVLNQLNKYKIKPVGIFASDNFARGGQFCGYPVQTYDALKKQYPEMVILVCFGTNRTEVLDNIERLSKEQKLYCPDVPVYGDNIFDLHFARKNASQIEQCYNLLADDLSRKTFENIILFKLTGKMQYLQQCELEEDLFGALSLTDHEIYLDLGAYRGDTVEEFLNKVTTYEHIYALEPNEKTFRKLSQNTATLDKITVINVAISDSNSQVYMNSDGRGCAIGAQGNLMQTITVDSLLNGRPATLIKMDVEGVEASALAGATQTISNYRPKMIIAAYHRSEDIFELPLLIHEMQSDYKIELRHFKHNLAWDTNYYFL